MAWRGDSQNGLQNMHKRHHVTAIACEQHFTMQRTANNESDTQKSTDD